MQADFLSVKIVFAHFVEHSKGRLYFQMAIQLLCITEIMRTFKRMCRFVLEICAANSGIMHLQFMGSGEENLTINDIMLNIIVILKCPGVRIKQNSA